jgi:hypothetical protein
MTNFGWSLPPGVSQRMIDDAYGQEAPCAVCGQGIDDCICPECPHCQTIGDLECYDGAVHCSWCGIKPAGWRATAETCSSCWAAASTGNTIVFTDRPGHGLVRTEEQARLLAEAEARWKQEAEDESYE